MSFEVYIYERRKNLSERRWCNMKVVN